jgi:hypothetical protein
MENTIVKWEVTLDIPEMYWDDFASCPDVDIYKKYEGTVIGTNRGWLGTYLVVKCTDGQIREVDITQVKVKEDG